jgi:predicted membrane channel-forming protein YqfA (hemolysin III family)
METLPTPVTSSNPFDTSIPSMLSARRPRGQVRDSRVSKVVEYRREDDREQGNDDSRVDGGNYKSVGQEEKNGSSTNTDMQTLTHNQVYEMRVVDLREALKSRGIKFTSKDLKPALVRLLLQFAREEGDGNVMDTVDELNDITMPAFMVQTEEFSSSFSLENPDSDDGKSEGVESTDDNMLPRDFITPRTLDLSERIKSLEESLEANQKGGGGLISYFFMYKWGPRDENVHDCYQKVYVDYGYRPVYGFRETITSLFSWHNETMNIWSHLIGFICTFIAVAKFALDLYAYDKETYSIERLMLGGYITCASICLLFSTLYHWFCCLSPEVSDSLLRVDLTGIALLIGSSYFPVSYFGFYCTPTVQLVYLGMSVLVLTSALVSPWIESTWKGVPVRTIMMASLAGVGIIPFAHWALITPRFYADHITPGNF